MLHCHASMKSTNVNLSIFTNSNIWISYQQQESQEQVHMAVKQQAVVDNQYKASDSHSSLQSHTHTHTHKHTHTHNHIMTLWIFSGTTQVSRYQKKHSPTHTYRGHQSSLTRCLHLLRSMASSLFNPRAWPSFSTICLQVLYGLPLGLVALLTSYSTHFFTQSLSSFRNTCPYLRNLFCCSTKIMSSNRSLSQPFSWDSIL